MNKNNKENKILFPGTIPLRLDKDLEEYQIRAIAFVLGVSLEFAAKIFEAAKKEDE